MRAAPNRGTARGYPGAAARAVPRGTRVGTYPGRSTRVPRVPGTRVPGSAWPRGAALGVRVSLELTVPAEVCT
eukprot:3591652-Rhodomonas_salina.2